MPRRFSLILLSFAAGVLSLLAQQPPIGQSPSTMFGPARTLRVVVLDPGHGGTDPGARGANGVVEKDVVLSLARATRAELERQGLRVLLTRDGDQNPSFDDRAAVANAQRDAIFISLHVSSTGPAGTARAYFYQFPMPVAPAASPVAGVGGSTSLPAVAPAPAPAGAGLVEWTVAQKPYTDLSRRLADLVQLQLAQKFAGSPEISAAVAERGLRSVTAPAVAVELSSVAVADPRSLEPMAPALAASIARAVASFRPVYEAGAK